MPRTKAPHNQSRAIQNNLIFPILQALEDDHKRAEASLKECLDQIDMKLALLKLTFSEADLQKTIKELEEEKENEKLTKTFSNISKECSQIVQSANKRKPPKRSKSANDEGYRTAESNDFSSSGSNISTSKSRMSRSRTKQTKNVSTISRSLSRTGLQKKFKTRNPYITPDKQNVPTPFGIITPKCHPQAPQVLLRRPKVGEFAVSLQGSPLMVSNVLGDNMANVNIPMEDGSLYSIMPQNGLRMSQLPPLDADTLSQIKALRDNLDKVVAFTKQK